MTNARKLIYEISGLDRFEARKKLWEELEETGLAVKKEPHTLRVPRSQRGGEVRYYFSWLIFIKLWVGLIFCHWFVLLFVSLIGRFSSFYYQVIEPLVSKQWFVTMEPLAEKALEAVEKGELTIIPERFEKVCHFLLLDLHIQSYMCIVD